MSLCTNTLIFLAEEERRIVELYQHHNASECPKGIDDDTARLPPATEMGIW